ncbi:KRAB-A domain-containing protein 2-like isoform X3 [Scylla paramamosain]|uniref:KRAB-A domain-containing protein 2-like isoform X3 n=1 Tax=Scylla paramamosain TaxID=85552 RepID=UPI00308398CF
MAGGAAVNTPNTCRRKERMAGGAAVNTPNTCRRKLFVSHQYNKMATWSSPHHPEHPLDRPPNQAADTEWETMFLQTILKWDVQQESHCNILTAEKYGSLLQEVKEAKTAKKKTSLQYRRLKRFDVIEIGVVQKLIASSKNDEVRYYVPAPEIFEVIKTSHVAIGHGGRDRLKCEINRKYANVTADMIKLFLTMCEVCQSKKNKKKRGLVSKPILHSELNSRCQVDLIDMQTQADGKYKFIMVYQDHLTKFVILRALQCKRAEEVAYHLVDIFLTFGAPCILQSDNGREFVNSVITSLASLWPELKIVHGKPRHSQSQGSVDVDVDVKDIPTDKEISLRSAATSSSVGTGQGFFRCHCTKHCATNICKCKKNKVLRNSKCHNSMSCKNK